MGTSEYKHQTPRGLGLGVLLRQALVPPVFRFCIAAR